MTARRAALPGMAGRVSAALVGLVFLAAAFLKGADLPLFAEQITGYALTPQTWSPALAAFFVVVEGLLGFALLCWIRPRWCLAASFGLLVAFMVATGLAWASGNASSCGCFGRLASRGPGGVIAEDALFLALLGVAWKLGPLDRSGGPIARAIYATGALASLIWPIAGAVAPVDSWITGLRRGSDLSEMAVDGLRVPVEQGSVLLALVGPNCPDCDHGLESLGRIATERSDLRVAAVYAGDRAAVQTWRLEHVPAFPVGHASEKSLRQYYRRLPTVFWLRDGKIEELWWGRIPGLAELPPAR